MLRQRYTWRGIAMFPSSLHCGPISSCRCSETIFLVQFKLSLKYLHHVGISDSRCSTQHVSHRRTITVDLVKQRVNTLGKKRKHKKDWLSWSTRSSTVPSSSRLFGPWLFVNWFAFWNINSKRKPGLRSYKDDDDKGYENYDSTTIK